MSILLQEIGDSLLLETGDEIILDETGIVITSTVIDENRVPAALAVSSADGETLLNLYANESLHTLYVDDGNTGSDMGGNPDPRNENRKVAFFAVSADDGVTPVAVYIDPVTNKLLIQST